jgi:hypothetical protein
MADGKMPLLDLINQNFEKYLTQNLNNQKPWFFIHIPKTAGSSFGLELAQINQPFHNIHTDADERALPYHQKLVDSIRSFNELHKREKFCLASGHVPLSDIVAEVEGWESFNLITMLRDPVRRTISDYRYQRTPLHSRFREFSAEFPTLESYLAIDDARNKMFRFLRPSATATLDECVHFLVERFSFIGAVEMYPVSFRLITRLMGREGVPVRYDRKTPDTELNRVEVTPKLIAYIRQINALDVALYDFFSSALRSARPFVLGGGARS